MGVRLLAVVASLLLVSLLVMNNSRAAFTDTTDATTGTWSSSGVSITEESEGGTFFTADEMVPGDVVSESTEVTYVGTAASVDVRLYAKDDSLTGDADLAGLLNLKIGTTPGADDVYGGTLATLATFAAGVTDWETGDPTIWTDVPVGETKTYYFEVELDPGADDDVQNVDASLQFVWEARSNPTQGQS
jgi:hypothetical protein